MTAYSGRLISLKKPSRAPPAAGKAPAGGIADFLPTRTARYHWMDGFRSYFTANAAALGYDAGNIAELTGLWDPNATSYGGLAPKENDYRAAVTQLDGDEEELISFVRELVGGIQASGSVTDAQRASAGLPIRKTTRTAPRSPSPVPSPRWTPRNASSTPFPSATKAPAAAASRKACALVKSGVSSAPPRQCR